MIHVNHEQKSSCQDGSKHSPIKLSHGGCSSTTVSLGRRCPFLNKASLHGFLDLGQRKNNWYVLASSTTLSVLANPLALLCRCQYHTFMTSHRCIQGSDKDSKPLAKGSFFKLLSRHFSYIVLRSSAQSLFESKVISNTSEFWVSFKWQVQVACILTQPLRRLIAQGASVVPLFLLKLPLVLQY